MPRPMRITPVPTSGLTPFARLFSGLEVAGVETQHGRKERWGKQVHPKRLFLEPHFAAG
jgi:hypothetical protein